MTFNKYTSKKSKIYYYLEKYCSKYCDAVITINNEDYKNVLKMNCKNNYYIHGVGVNIKKYASSNIDRVSYRKQLGIDKTIR